jgi:hypothetical protein
MFQAKNILRIEAKLPIKEGLKELVNLFNHCTQE